MTRVTATGKESSSNFSPDNGTGLAVRTALKDVLESLRTVNSASGDPSGSANLAAYQLHINTDDNLLKIRNGANSAFITLGDVSSDNLGLLPRTGGVLTGVLGLSTASASAPSVHFGDSTTGFFRKGSNQIGVAFAGSEKIFFDQNAVNLNDSKSVRFFELASNGSNQITFKGPDSIASNRTITLPDETGTVVTSASIVSQVGGQNLTGLHTLTPATNNVYNLGSSALRWANLFINDLNLSNEGHKNDVDGTWGSYTIQEGADDLFLVNRRNGKKFRFVLQEVIL